MLWTCHSPTVFVKRDPKPNQKSELKHNNLNSLCSLSLSLYLYKSTSASRGRFSECPSYLKPNPESKCLNLGGNGDNDAPESFFVIYFLLLSHFPDFLSRATWLAPPSVTNRKFIDKSLKVHHFRSWLTLADIKNKLFFSQTFSSHWVVTTESN